MMRFTSRAAEARGVHVSPPRMQDDIEEVLIDHEAIGRRVAELAEQITRDFGDDEQTPAKITLVPILTGSFMFAADLMRHLPLRLQTHLMSVSSYPGAATTSQGAAVQQALTNVPDDLSGLHVLIVDDILDSGSTLRLVRDTLAAKKPDSLASCVLLRKDRPEALAFEVDYIAFNIPDRFVVGYGLDYDGYYRNLPEICTLKPDALFRAC